MRLVKKIRNSYYAFVYQRDLQRLEKEVIHEEGMKEARVALVRQDRARFRLGLLGPKVLGLQSKLAQLRSA